MARQNGRDLQVLYGSTPTMIAVLNTKTVNINNNPVDVTGDTDDGWITLLDRPGTRQVTIDASGYSETEALRSLALGQVLMQDVVIRYLDDQGASPVYEMTGSFYFATFSETGASDGGIEFTCNFQSSGEVTGATVP